MAFPCIVPRAGSRELRRSTRHALLGAGASLLLIVLAACGGAGQPTDPLAGLVRAVGEERFTLPWLSAFPEHRECTETDTGYCPDRPALSPRALTRWAARLTGSGDPPTAAGLHAQGVWHLLFPPAGPAKAVVALERSRELVPGDWRVANDLAAAELLRGLGGDPLRLLDALAAAEAAVEIAPEALPPRFNLALILERLGLEEDARQAWREVLGADPAVASGGWRDEAADRLADLDRGEPTPAEVSEEVRNALADAGDRLQALVASHPQDAYRVAQENVLEHWARTVTEAVPLDRIGNSPAALLDEALRLGETLAAVTGDRFVLGTANRAIALDPSERPRLAAALRHLAVARDRYDARDFAGAERELVAARRRADGLDTPLDPWIDYYLLLCAYWRQDPSFDDRLATLEAKIDQDELPILGGYLLWAAGLSHIDAGRFVTGRRLYRRAIARFTSTGQTNEAALLHTLLADVEARLGDLGSAWSEALAATAQARDFRNPRHLWAAWDQAARIATLAGHDRAALRLQDVALQAAERAASPSTVSAAFAARAHTRLRLGDRPGARNDLEQAHRWAGQITEEAVRHRVEASILLAQSRSGVLDATEADIARLTRALEQYRQIDSPVLYPELLLERSRLFAETGASTQAERDLLEALDLLRDQTRHLDALDERLRFTAAARKAIEALLELHLEPGGDRRAIPALADLARDPLRKRTKASSLDAEGATAALGLPPNEAALSVTVLPNRFVLWIARGDRTAYVTEPVAADELRHRLWALAREPTAEDLAWFYDRILGPHRSQLGDVKRLFLALDRGLYSLPIGALLDTATGGYLVEEMAVAVVPEVCTLRGEVEAEATSPPVRLALIAAPWAEDPDGAATNDRRVLEELRHVEHEANLLADLYPETRTLAPPVTATRLAAAGTWADVLHVASHGVVNLVEPDLSRLLIGPEPLYARDIRQLRFSRRPTVVLAACETGVTAPEDSSGVSSLAAAFLEAGAHWVIGSTWPLDDALTVRFVERLHTELLRGTSPDRALRRTQVQFLRSGELPFREWAAYQAFTDGRSETEHPADRAR